MSKTTGTVRVKEEPGSRMCFRVESWSKPDQCHRVDLLARGGYSECSCANSQIAVWGFIKAGGSWYDPKASCRHTKAARKYFEHKLYTTMAKEETPI